MMKGVSYHFAHPYYDKLLETTGKQWEKGFQSQKVSENTQIKGRETSNSKKEENLKGTY